MDIEKHLTITSSSSISWKDAVSKAISEASKTIDYLSSVNLVSQKALIDGNKISEYIVVLDLGFNVDVDRNTRTIDDEE